VNGANLKDVLKRCTELGCTVERIKGTGEKIVSHPDVEKKVRINARRKDAPRSLTSLLKRVEKAREARKPICLRRGFKTLARQFRAYLNREMPREDFDDWLKFADARVQLAKRFKKERDLDRDTYNELVGHVPVTKTKGWRACFACMESK
jgi:hypothetical protein